MMLLNVICSHVTTNYNKMALCPHVEMWLQTNYQMYLILGTNVHLCC